MKTVLRRLILWAIADDLPALVVAALAKVRAPKVDPKALDDIAAGRK